jgi:hypothetical protein
MTIVARMTFQAFTETSQSRVPGRQQPRQYFRGPALHQPSASLDWVRASPGSAKTTPLLSLRRQRRGRWLATVLPTTMPSDPAPDVSLRQLEPAVQRRRVPDRWAGLPVPRLSTCVGGHPGSYDPLFFQTSPGWGRLQILLFGNPGQHLPHFGAGAKRPYFNQCGRPARQFRDLFHRPVLDFEQGDHQAGRW